jgi:HPt (histidine-containing phosphotransfer) domain-containing protein
MNSLDSRKQLLVAESELNRAQLVQEWRTMASEVHALTEQARSISSIASAVATLVAGLSSLRHKKSELAAEKPSWWKTLLKGAGLASSFWQAFRSQDCGQKEE